MHLAHQVLGRGRRSCTRSRVCIPRRGGWDWPYLARFQYRLASFGPLTLFDKRGTGLSDPMKRPPTLDGRVDDIRAVMNPVGGASRLSGAEGGR